LMITAIAVDDEPLALQVLENFATRCDRLQLKKVFTRPHEAQRYIQSFPVDMVFLDIQMPSMNGLDLKKELDPQVPVIFTTAFSEFAVEGFNLNAIDYLLKPFSYDRFVQAVDKVEAFIGKRLSDQSLAPTYMMIRADYSLIKIFFSEIELIEGLDDYIKIHLKDQRPVVARLTMKSVFSKLPVEQFARIHRSFIVPMRLIESVRNKLVTIGERQLPIGLSYEESFMNRLKQDNF
ncbi:MAG: LytR/AlgR family response regulator transcription factor, partial [Flavobacteriales bacterium]